MTTIQKLLLISVAAIVMLPACTSVPDQLPTPTPVDAALQRLTPEPVEEEPADEPAETDTAVEAEDTTAETSTESESNSDLEAVFAASGCVACHAVEADAAAGIGPSMVGLGSRAAAAIEASDYTGEATTVEEYIREAILNPQIYISPDYMPVMPATYQDSLTEEQIDQLVEYLQTFE